MTKNVSESNNGYEKKLERTSVGSQKLAMTVVRQAEVKGKTKPEGLEGK